MQTLSVQIQDNYIPTFLEYVNKNKTYITIEDKNLKLDPYFYDRQKKLQQIKKDIDSGKTQMIDDKTFWDDIDSLTNEIF